MKRLFLDNFWLKIIALITMTIAHVGNFMAFFTPNFIATDAYFALQVVGKIAFPIYVFLLIEGLNHTHSRKNYFIRLGVMAGLMYVVELVINLPFVTNNLATGGIERFGNIFVDLLVLAFTYCLLNAKEKKHKWYVLIPITYICLMTGLKIYDAYTTTPLPVPYLYAGLFLQYDLIGLLILLGYHYGYKLNDYIIKKAMKDDELFDEFKQTPQYLWRKNTFASISIVLVSVVCYLISIIGIPNIELYCDFAILSYVALGAVFLLFYSGKVGFKNKYIQGAFYLYYPLHLVIIFLILYMI